MQGPAGAPTRGRGKTARCRRPRRAPVRRLAGSTRTFHKATQFKTCARRKEFKHCLFANSQFGEFATKANGNTKTASDFEVCRPVLIVEDCAHPHQREGLCNHRQSSSNTTTKRLVRRCLVVAARLKLHGYICSNSGLTLV